MAALFSSETIQSGRQWSNISKVWKEINYQEKSHAFINQIKTGVLNVIQASLGGEIGKKAVSQMFAECANKKNGHFNFMQ